MIQQGTNPAAKVAIPAGGTVSFPVKSPAFVRFSVAEQGSLLTTTILVESAFPCRFTLQGLLTHD
jgi:hypothetical protein